MFSKSIDQAKRRTSSSSTIYPIWFSDTFVFYSLDDTGNSFAWVDQVARWFTYFLICSDIPVRGALSCDDFYADRNNNLYYGPALVEAYEYAEAQDWIGFLLSPSSVLQLDNLGYPASERLDYAYCHVPFKKGRENRIGKLPACILGQWSTINGKNACLDNLADISHMVYALRFSRGS